MSIEASQMEGAVVLRITGRMDAENTRAFEEACEVWINNGSSKLIVDLARLAYISSMGLRSFVGIGQQLSSKGGKLRLCGLAGLVRQVFQITHLDTVFPIYETVDGALAEA